MNTGSYTNRDIKSNPSDFDFEICHKLKIMSRITQNGHEE